VSGVGIRKAQEAGRLGSREAIGSEYARVMHIDAITPSNLSALEDSEIRCSDR